MKTHERNVANGWVPQSAAADLKIRSACPEVALGILDLTLDDRVKDRAEGRQLGKGRSTFWRGGKGCQRLELTCLEKLHHRASGVEAGHVEIHLLRDERDEGLSL